METSEFDPALFLTDEASIAGAIEDALNDPDSRVLPIVLRDVAQVRGVSVAQLAELAGVSRESLYKTLKGNTDAKWRTVQALLRALGLRLTVAA